MINPINAIANEILFSDFVPQKRQLVAETDENPKMIALLTKLFQDIGSAFGFALMIYYILNLLIHDCQEGSFINQMLNNLYFMENKTEFEGGE